MIFGTESNGVQVEFVMIQNQVWSIQGRIKIPSRKTLRTGVNWVAWNLRVWMESHAVWGNTRNFDSKLAQRYLAMAKEESA